MGKHTAWKTFNRTRNPEPPPQPKPFLCTERNMELWLDEECPACEMWFDLNVKAIVVGGLMYHFLCV